MHRTESELVELAAGGDFEAFDVLVSLYEDRLYWFALKMLSNEEDAHEVVQDSFLSAYRSLASFRGEASFYTWLNRIAMNFCFTKLKNRKKESGNISLEEVHPFPDGKPVGASIPSWDITPEKFTIKSELADAMRASLDELPEMYRVVFVLKDIEGMSNEEIAAALELSVPAVKSRLNRARLFLRKKLSPYFSASQG